MVVILGSGALIDSSRDAVASIDPHIAHEMLHCNMKYCFAQKDRKKVAKPLEFRAARRQ
jgi:hypothetical protein